MQQQNNENNSKKDNDSQFISDNKKIESITSCKELLYGKDKMIVELIKRTQNSTIKYCRNVNDLQLNTNFFKMTFGQQLQFNECVTKVSNKIKDDFTQLESFYSNCKNNCIDTDIEVEANLFKYNNAKNRITKPKLHPCISSCKSLFFGMHESYEQYFIKGIYNNTNE